MTSEHNNGLFSSKQDETATTIEMYFQAILDISGDPLFIKNNECQLLLVNDAFCSLFGLPREQIIGHTLAERVSEEERNHFLSIDRKVLAEGKEITCQESLTTSSSKIKTLLTKKRRFIDAKGERFLVGIIKDITERTQNRLREKTRSQVLEMITKGDELPDILKAILNIVEQENADMLCSVLLLDNSGKYLKKSIALNLPDYYNDAIEGLTIGYGIGSCGTAAFLNERVIVDDIQTHPFWEEFRELAAKAKLRACWSEPIRGSNGEVLGTFGIYHRYVASPSKADLRVIEQTASLASIAIEKKQAEEHLKRAASVFTHAHEGIMITDASAAIIEVNDTFSKITGYSFDEVFGKNPRLLQSNRHSPQFYAKMWDSIKTNGHWRGEIWNKRKNGEIYPETLTVSAVKNSAGEVQHYVSLSTDITILKANQGQLERIAHYDLLTNLPNRVLLADRLNQAMKHCKRSNKSLAVAFMDLDGFKAVNDNYGHNIGDELLVEVSSAMNKALREGDTLARIGGDEFIAIMVDLERFEDCEIVLARLLKAASTPIPVANTFMQVSASIGLTLYPHDSVDAEQLIRHADQAMYIAKQSGKNSYHLFDTAQDDAINTQRKSIDSIQRAIQKDEFVLHYQPKVNMRTGEIIGAEALIRWQHPENGLTPPATFLPMIEGHALSVNLGEWVIETTLKQIIAWRKMGIELPISINISAYQLQQNNFTQRLTTLLAAYPEVDPDFLELEILETSALNDTNQVSNTMSDCQKLGVSFALDDFGTGYSSLTYLKRLPAYMIKIDQSFVRDMLDDKDDLAIVKGVVGLAAAFQRTVIAEGVESIEHGSALLALGCELAQGYGIAKPMHANDIPQWISIWNNNESWRLLREAGPPAMS